MIKSQKTVDTLSTWYLRRLNPTQVVVACFDKKPDTSQIISKFLHAEKESIKDRHITSMHSHNIQDWLERHSIRVTDRRNPSAIEPPFRSESIRIKWTGSGVDIWSNRRLFGAEDVPQITGRKVSAHPARYRPLPLQTASYSYYYIIIIIILISSPIRGPSIAITLLY